MSVTALIDMEAWPVAVDVFVAIWMHTGGDMTYIAASAGTAKAIPARRLIGGASIRTAGQANHEHSWPAKSRLLSAISVRLPNALPVE